MSMMTRPRKAVKAVEIIPPPALSIESVSGCNDCYNLAIHNGFAYVTRVVAYGTIYKIDLNALSKVNITANLDFPTTITHDAIGLWATVAGWDHSGIQVIKVNPDTGDYVGTSIPFLYGRPEVHTSDGTNLWIGTTDPGIFKVDPVTRTVIHQTSIGAAPKIMYFDGAYIWVGLASNSVLKIDQSGTIIGLTGTGVTPTGITFDGTDIFVSCGTGKTIKRINRTNNNLLDTFTYSSDVLHIVWLNNKSKLYAIFADGSLCEINKSTGAIINTVVLPATTWCKMAYDGINKLVVNHYSTSTVKVITNP